MFFLKQIFADPISTVADDGDDDERALNLRLRYSLALYTRTRASGIPSSDKIKLFSFLFYATTAAYYTTISEEFFYLSLARGSPQSSLFCVLAITYIYL